MNKKSMSVTEMRKLLGIGKTDSYWLVKKGYFETVIIAGKMRIMVDSFEKWYDNQLHYRKVDGTPQGRTGQASHFLFGKWQRCLEFLTAAFTGC